MPEVIRVGQYKIKIHTREPEYKVPHVHVEFEPGEEVEVSLLSLKILAGEAPGHEGNIRTLVEKHFTACWNAWDKFHS
jgi:hypothetical protein